MRSILRPSQRFLFLVLVAGLTFGCSTSSKKSTPAKANEKKVAKKTTGTAPMVNDDATMKDLQAAVNQLNQRLVQVDMKVSALDDVRASKKVKKKALTKKKGQAVVKHPAQHSGKPSISKRKRGFVNDERVQRFRKAFIFFETGKWSEAILEFSAFLRDFADHPMASAAQFYIGESYFKQNEYRLSIQEFQRVLVSYDRSSYVPNSLLRMAQAEEKLKLYEDAARHRQMLLSLFPQSPAARSLSQSQMKKKQSGVQNQLKSKTVLKERAVADLGPFDTGSSTNAFGVADQDRSNVFSVVREDKK